VFNGLNIRTVEDQPKDSASKPPESI